MAKAPKKRAGPPKGTGGRPPIPESERKVDVGVRMTRAEVEQIDLLTGGIKGARSAVIRELVAEALKSREKKGRKS